MAVLALLVWSMASFGQYVRPFSPEPGLTYDSEKLCRDEICLNGRWDVCCVPIPEGWKPGTGVAPVLPLPQAGCWEPVRIKIPSPLNVNVWGEGYSTGEGTKKPYVPSSVYYPSYPEHWNSARMAWLRRSFDIPRSWEGKRVILHFEAVAGECRVVVNGREAGVNFDNHTPFEFDVTGFVEPGKACEVLVGLRSHKLFDKKHPDYRYMGATYPTGSNTDALFGIWQDVYAFAVPEVHVSDVFVKPLVSRGELVAEVTVENNSSRSARFSISGSVKEWINDAGADVATAPEPRSHIGRTMLVVEPVRVSLKPGESKVVSLRAKVAGELDCWTPSTPILYMLELALSGKEVADLKAARFGWREFRIVGDEFRLNGEKIQCFGDIQHPFSAYICSRRFAWAWYRMIKDFGGNAVRPHAQPWPRCYYDLADEMGLMVLDETGLFGSSIRANFEEEQTWQKSAEQLRRLILRDRNHPSVIGWSAGNETFAIALLNKPPQEIADRWDRKLAELASTARLYDDTRDFITLDGDTDMHGTLPVWSKHFGHGLRVGDLPKNLGKPLVVGEFGATYYGRPEQLYPFIGEDAFLSYKGRNEALAIDLYRNIRQMALPYVAYFSPSEVSWFGLEHLNLGYHDFSRLPNLRDGIFPAGEYVEGVPGYQYERIPPYVTTFNPGLDPELPLYKPLAMFEAYKAALSGAEWQPYEEVVRPARAPMPEPVMDNAYVPGGCSPELAVFLGRCGLRIADRPSDRSLWVVDASLAGRPEADAVASAPAGTVVLVLAGDGVSREFSTITGRCRLEDRPATALEVDKTHPWGSEFQLPDLYFAEMEGDKHILKTALAGDILERGAVLFIPSRTDWSLFNNVAEHWKCAQVVLYEALKREPSAAFLTMESSGRTIALTTIDWKLDGKEPLAFWKELLGRMGVEMTNAAEMRRNTRKRGHDLLMDGPVD